MKPIDTMTPAEVNQEIAERLYPPSRVGPDIFCQDHNACHEAWMMLTEEQKMGAVIIAGKGWGDCFPWGFKVALDADAFTLAKWILAAARTGGK